MDPADILAGLDDEQRDAVVADTTPLRIVAGAGSGKTRVLTRRIAYQSALDAIDPRKVLALTFTRKAALQLGSRLAQLGLRDRVAAGTFHSVAYAQLRQYWTDRNRKPPALVERKAALVGRVVPRNLSDRVLEFIGEIEWAKARLITPERYAEAAAEADRRPPAPLVTVASAYEAYENEKRRRRVVDFDDLLSLCRSAIERDAEFGAAQRWRFRHFFVDEFQDVNPSQFALLSAWLGTSADLCVVGDPRQAIYSWNGADSRYMNDFDTYFVGAKSISLLSNYRSTPQVIAVAHAALPPPRELARTNRANGPTPRIVAYANDTTEAAAIASLARTNHRPGTRWRDQAVLVRINAQLPLFEEAFRRAGIPFRTRGGGLLRTPEAKAILRTIEQSRAPFASVLDELAHDIYEAELVLDGQDDSDVADTKTLVLDTIVRLGHEYLIIDPNATAATFLRWLTDTTGNERIDDGADAIELATFHAAKGLEWPIVYVTGLEQGLVPISYAQRPEAIDEERRLLYVALSRAEQQLVCTWARERTLGGRVSRRSPSPLLAELQAALDRLDGVGRGVDHRGRAAGVRQQLKVERPAVPDAADPLLKALKAWRGAQARAANVPAYIVFSDATLAAICEQRPQSRAALSRVPGIGPVKIDRYGDAILDLVKQS